MGLLLEKTNQQGVVYNYWRIASFTANFNDNNIQIIVKFYAYVSKTIRDNGGLPIEYRDEFITLPSILISTDKAIITDDDFKTFLYSLKSIYKSELKNATDSL